MADAAPPGLAEFLTPETPQTPQPEAGGAVPPGLDQFLHSEVQEETYGTPGQQAISVAEGAAKGLLGPVATGLELAGGVKPEAIRGREEVNPKSHGIAEAATFLGSALAGTGEAAVLGEIGKAAEAGAGLQRATRVSQMGTEAARAAFEAGLYQGGEEIHKNWTKDPNQSAESAIANIGMTSVMGGLFGGALGAALRPVAPEAGTFVSELDRPAFDSGDIKTHMTGSASAKPAEQNKIIEAFKLNKEKAEAPAIRKAAAEIGAPVLDGMTLESPLIQTNLDALINSPYTVSGNAVRTKFDEAYNAADGALQGAISAGESGSKAELGDSIKNSVSAQIRDQYAPIQAIYQQIEEHAGVIPLNTDAAAMLSKGLRDIKEVRVSPSSPEGQLVKRVLTDIKNVKTVDDLNVLKGTVKSIDPETRHIAGIIRSKLDEIADTAIDSAAKGAGLKEAMRDARAQYKPFIQNVQTLAEKLGKGKIHGVEDALNFINDRLTPEEVSSRLFNKKDSEFTKFFQKNFPNEFQQVRNYQRAEMIEKATKGETGFSAKTFYNNFNKLEPETQRALYTGSEIKKIQATETYIRDAFPKNFNPSGTAHMMAHRLAHETPKSMILANARDFGMSKAIELASKYSEGKQALALAQATVKGEKLANNVIKGIFNKSQDVPRSLVPSIPARLKLDKLVESYTKDPSKMVAMNDNNTSVPEYSQAFSASAARVVQYLAAMKPKTDPKAPLDTRRPANSVEKSTYERAVDIAQQPLVVLKSLGEGRLTSKDVLALKTMYPNLYSNLAQKMSQAMADSVAKGQPLPYATRMGLSLFLGQALDSSMTPASISAIQMRHASPSHRPDEQMQAGQPPSESSVKGLQKLPGMAQTQGQQREMSRATGKH